MFFNGKLDMSFFDNFLHVSLVADKIRHWKIKAEKSDRKFFYYDFKYSVRRLKAERFRIRMKDHQSFF